MSSSKDCLVTRLHQAARDGNTSAISELLREDPLLLQRIGAGSPTETPLHIASLLGHVEFAAALLEMQPDLARMRDEQGFYPLHLAAAKGHLQVVKMMLQGRADLCKLRDKEGRTPLHSSAANGQIDVLKELLSHVDEATAHARTERGETTLHLCVKYNQFEAAKILVDKDKSLVNMKDADGNTVLHIATARKQIQLLELFLGVDGVDAEAKNEHRLTALDVLVHSPSERGDIKIVEILESAGCKRATIVANRSDSNTNPEKNEVKLMKQIRTNYLIAATVIATVTFTAGFSPPGSVWTEPPKPPKEEAPTPSVYYEPGTAILSEKDLFYGYFVSNTIAFLASCSIIILLLKNWTPTQLKNGFLRMSLSAAMGVAIVSMTSAFCIGAALVSFEHTSTAVMLIGFYVWVFVIFASCFAFKYCKERERHNQSHGTATDVGGGQNV